MRAPRLIALCIALSSAAVASCADSRPAGDPPNEQPRIESITYRDGQIIVQATDPDGTIVSIDYGVNGGPSGIADGSCRIASPAAGWALPLDVPQGTYRVRVTAESVVCDDGRAHGPSQEATKSATVRVP